MRISFIGAGGIGCYYAARLINAGEKVTLVARGDHLSALQHRGIKVTHPDLNFYGSVEALELDQWLEKTSPDQVDLIIICLKAMQTTGFAIKLANWFTKKASKTSPLILSLQNGVENEKILNEFLPDQCILGGIARRIGAHIIKPGIVDAVGPAQVILGVWPNHLFMHSDDQLKPIEEIVNCFNHALIPTEISTDINKELWRKLIINNGVNPLCALLQIETGIATSDQQLQILIKGAMAEAATAAKAEGVELSDREVDEMFELISTFDSIKPSMLVDREKGNQLEVEEICGVVLRAHEKLGKDAPYNRCIYSLLEHELNKIKNS